MPHNIGYKSKVIAYAFVKLKSVSDAIMNVLQKFFANWAKSRIIEEMISKDI